MNHTTYKVFGMHSACYGRQDAQYTFPSYCWAQLLGFNKFPFFVGIGLSCLKLGQTSLHRIVTQQYFCLEYWGDFPSYCWYGRLAFLKLLGSNSRKASLTPQHVTPTLLFPNITIFLNPNTFLLALAFITALNRSGTCMPGQ